MKYLIILLSPLFVFLNSAPNENLNSSNVPNVENNEDLIKLVNDFQGDWISKSYIDRLRSTNSPFQAQNESFKNLFIDSSMIDSDYIGVSIYEYGATEMPSTSYFRRIESTKFQFSHSKFEEELIRDTCMNNCVMLEFSNEKGTKVIRLSSGEKTEEFVQIPKNCNYYHLCELNEYANQLFLSGTHQLLDAKRKIISPNVEIKSNGVVFGCDFEKIQVWTYFREINGIFEQDVIQIGRANENLEYFQGNENNVFYFEVSNNETLLYSLKVDMENYLVEKDKLAYVLRRK